MARVVLISTYEMGRQPFGLASPAAWLRRDGAEVTCLDLSREPLRETVVRQADWIAIHVPMHTATRLAARLVPRLKRLNPRAKLCFYGLYAPVNEEYLRGLGADAVLGGEFENGLAALVGGARAGEPGGPVVSLARQKFVPPDREGLPALADYAKLRLPDGGRRVVGYTEASRGCKHVCRHCPIVPVYEGAFRVVQPEVALEDIRRQVARGAGHITFGDPDFFNGPTHAMRIVKALHREHPGVSYDVTIKVEHLLRHSDLLAALSETGCLFVTSAVESFDDHVLGLLDKGHTRDDALRVVELFRQLGLTLAPTFVPFTPWTTLEGYQEFLWLLVESGLVEHVAPIQLAIRLLIPPGSRLLELPEVRDLVAEFDPQGLCYPWRHEDARVEQLCEKVRQVVHAGERRQATRGEIFAQVWNVAYGKPLTPRVMPSRTTIPYLEEPWYC